MDIWYNHKEKPRKDKQNCRIMVTPVRDVYEPWVGNGVSLG